MRNSVLRPYYISKQLAFVFFVCISFGSYSQAQVEDYLGGWAGELYEPNPFLFDIILEKDSNNNYNLNVKGKDVSTFIKLERDENNYLFGSIEDQLKITIEIDDENPIAFVQVGHHLSFLDLVSVSRNRWEGDWNLLICEEGVRPTLYLSLDKFDNGEYGASPFWKEPTLHYMLGQNFRYEAEVFKFTDGRSKIKFRGKLEGDKISMDLDFLNEKVKIEFKPLPYNKWKIGDSGLNHAIEDVNKLKNDLFSNLTDDIENDTLVGTHSVVVSQKGEIIYEKYFEGFNADIPHDTRSLSKSFASAFIGIAIDQKLIENEFIPIKKFYDKKFPEIDWSDGKDSISIFNLLTMSSGLDAIDFGINRMSFANEGAYQNREDWTGHILEAPMINHVGEVANYGSGSPHLLAPILADKLSEKLIFFMHKNLFQPLGIENYKVQTNNKEQPYFGGGWYFTPKDLIKFGELYLNKGEWDGKQIISEQWIEKSMDKYFVLENTIDKNEYGYLFWHKTYEVGKNKIESIEARGTGGQYLFIIPEYELVVVITSGNYRNNKAFQPEKIIEKYILQEIVKHN